MVKHKEHLKKINENNAFIGGGRVSMCNRSLTPFIDQADLKLIEMYLFLVS